MVSFSAAQLGLVELDALHDDPEQPQHRAHHLAERTSFPHPRFQADKPDRPEPSSRGHRSTVELPQHSASQRSIGRQLARLHGVERPVQDCSSLARGLGSYVHPDDRAPALVCPAAWMPRPSKV